MTLLPLFRWGCRRATALIVGFALACAIGAAATARADTPATMPAAAPATTQAATPAVLDKDVDPVPDPSGAAGSTPAAKKGDAPPTGTLLTPNGAMGYPVVTTDSKTGVATPKTAGLTPDETTQTI